MCGAFVRMRKCSSASLGSGTFRKRASVAFSATASRKPTIGWELREVSALRPLSNFWTLEEITISESRTESGFMRLFGQGKKVEGNTNDAMHQLHQLVLYLFYETSHDDPSE